MKKQIFTICCNNYLPQAGTLGESIKQHNPDWKFQIILLDRMRAEIDYSRICCDEISEIEHLGIRSFEEISRKYNVIELSTAIKAGVFGYLFDKNPDAEYVMYLDPDIKVYGSFEKIIAESGTAEIALTPHALTPIPLDEFEPKENLFLNHGVFNLGFLLLKRGAQSKSLLHWWEERMQDKCIIDLKEGYFVDQLWMNLVPLYFDSVCTLRNPGLNFAYWNFHERKITSSLDSARFIVNEKSDLIFVHFSSFSPILNNDFCWRGLTRYNLESRPDLTSLYKKYKDDLIRNDYTRLSKITPYYEEIRQNEILRLKKSKSGGFVKRLIRSVFGLVPKNFKDAVKKSIHE